jgi:hypothetical protein
MDNDTSIFAFYFKESGGLLPVNNYVLFDSLSKELVHVNLDNKSVSKKLLKDVEGQTKNLRDAILIAQFFDLKPVYNAGGPDMIRFLLTVTDMGAPSPSKSKTVSWYDGSEVHGVLSNVVTEIKKLLD